jgi:glycosyltransferase involved in cell wall biosynthesis
MKFLHIIPSANPESGGPIESVQHFNQGFTQRGHRSDTVCLDSPQDPWIDGFSSGKLYALGPATSGYRHTKTLIPWLTRYCTDYDCILVHGIWQYHSLATWQVLRHTNIPYFVFPHGMLDPWFKHTYPLKHLKKWLYWPWADYQVLRDARAVLFTCEAEKLLARQSFWLYHCREEVVNYGIQSPPVSPEYQQQFIRAFPELSQKRILLFLGRIHPKKGCDLLIEAFATVMATSADQTLQLVIAGPDSVGWRNKLEARAQQLSIQHNITWTGMLQGSLKWGALGVAEVFILPSHQENFGLSVAEALAYGVPVLISDKVNIWREVLADGAGFVAEDTLAGTIDILKRWLAIEAHQRSLLKQNIQHCFSKRFEFEQMMVSFFNTLKQCGVE